MGSDIHMEEEFNLRSHIEQLQIRVDYNQRTSDYWNTLKLDLHTLLQKKDMYHYEDGQIETTQALLDRMLFMEKEDCQTCKDPGMHPSHNGSSNCKSGSIASGGLKSHCSCDSCF